MIAMVSYKERLKEARHLIETGHFREARAILDDLQLSSSPAVEEETSLGLPRRLQSALLKLAKAENDPIRKIGYQFHLVPPPEKLAVHAVFSPEERRKIAGFAAKPVPRLIHQIWIGPKDVPPAAAAWAAHANAHDYDYRLWREEDLKSAGYDGHPVFSEMLEAGDFPGAVDVARYLILRDLGGIYLDCDWFPARRTASFHDFLPMTGIAAFAEDIPRNTGAGGVLLGNSFIAAPPQHPVLIRMVDVLGDVVSAMPDAPAWWTTGPLLFSVLCRTGPVCLAGHGFVAATLPGTASLAEVQSLAGELEAQGSGPLIAWKSW